MTVWQAWNIGKGMKISKTGSPQGETGVIATRPFLKPKVTSGILKKTIVEPSSCPAAKNEPNVPDVKDKEPVKFYCPEEGCIKAYSCSRYLKQHLDIGKHEFKLHEESQYDQIQRKWAQKCTSLKPPNPSCPPMVSSASNSEEVHVPDLVTGWALKKSKQCNRFPLHVKSYLVGQFLIGEDTGRKVTPAETSTRMRSMRDSNGKRVFDKEDWLMVQQITSYFSRLAAMKKLGQLPPGPLTEEEGEEVEVAVRTTEIYNLRESLEEAHL
ncbi:uncharacterized protein LOC116296104 [Actinia tenebrosa]|uniref:Uncharacterized protein LOC116296104 n=1 Tax=Actinia tenebrosa TaxID=6105 RepID=A0A6P8HX66_ACTTE|nr:uncharacterized protein LOC116296104 [Actinia tenebrosa]